MNTSGMAAFSVEAFSAGKNPPKNEDFFGYNETTVVLSDGATDKTGQRYEENTETGEFKTGGEVASRLVVDAVMSTTLNGHALVSWVTTVLRGCYEKHNPVAITDSAYKFCATMVVARIVGDELLVTQVGDSPFRINGRDEYTNTPPLDTQLASKRALYIKDTGDVEGGRQHIMPDLMNEHSLQNNDHEELGFGVLDGAAVPDRFVRTFTFPLGDVQTIELASDGYYGAFPKGVSIDAYEKLHKHIERVDPHKIKAYASTKTADDRTIVIASVA